MTSTTPTAVIAMAVNKGTRMRSITPKVLHWIGGRSLVDHAVITTRRLEPQHLVVVMHHECGAVIARLTEVTPGAIPAEQDEVPGTGRTVTCGLAVLLEDLTGPVVATSGDVPLLGTATLRELLAQHHECGGAATLLTIEFEDPIGHGWVVREADGTVPAVVEQRDTSGAQRAVREVNAGVYVFDVIHLRTALTTLGTDNDQGGIYLTDVVAHAHQTDRSISALITTGHWFVEGCNGHAQLAELGAELNRRVLVGWTAQGVGVISPASTWVGVVAEFAQDVTPEQGVLARGTTRIGQGARAGVYAILTDAVIPAGCVVTPFSQLDADATQA